MIPFRHCSTVALLSSLAACSGGGVGSAVESGGGEKETNISSAPILRGDSLATKATPVVGNSAVGVWSPLYDWPVLSMHSALLPDGRVLTYGTNLSNFDPARPYNFFMYDVFDPKVDAATPEAHLTLENTTGTYLSCSAQVLLPLTGEMMLAGGDVLVNGVNTERGNPDVNLFNPVDNSLRAATTGKMNLPRWYGTTTVMPNGDIYVQGGIDGEAHPEIRNAADGVFRLLKGIDTLVTDPTGTRIFTNNYPRNFVAPNGKVFGIDHHYMYEIDPYAQSVQIFGAHWDVPHTSGNGEKDRGWSLTSSTVMYRPGKILVIGGSTGNNTEIDFNGPTPVLTDLTPLAQTRQWANATVLPDGKVFLSGGSTVNQLSEPTGSPGDIYLDTATYDPATSTWAPGASIAVPRLYHSSTLLLSDGTVLSSGGGLPGPVTNLNAQIYYPGYLYNGDGTPAARPVIDAVPPVTDPATAFAITSRDTSAVTRITLVKTGSVTHSTDMDQRFIELPFTVLGPNQIQASLPANKFETPPGFYMLFALNAAGTPSEAKMIRINPTVQ